VWVFQAIYILFGRNQFAWKRKKEQAKKRRNYIEPMKNNLGNPLPGVLFLES